VATIRVHTIPNAKIDKVVGWRGDVIKIKLRGPAIEGRANAALHRFLADQLKIPKRTIILRHGQRSRNKVIWIDGLTEEDVRRRLRVTI